MNRKRRRLAVLLAVSNLIWLAGCQKEGGSSRSGESARSENSSYVVETQGKEAKLLSLTGATIEENKVLLIEEAGTLSVDLNPLIQVSKGATWLLALDKYGQHPIADGIARSAYYPLTTTLEGGDNNFYLLVTSGDQKEKNVYSLNIYVCYNISVTYYYPVASSHYDKPIPVQVHREEILSGKPFSPSYVCKDSKEADELDKERIDTALKGTEFQYWETKDGTRWENGTPFKDLSLYAHVAGKEFQVTLDPDGGTLEKTRATVCYGEAYSLPAPTKPGYTFSYWRWNNPEDEYDSETFDTEGKLWPFAEDITLKAVYSINDLLTDGILESLASSSLTMEAKTSLFLNKDYSTHKGTTTYKITDDKYIASCLYEDGSQGEAKFYADSEGYPVYDEINRQNEVETKRTGDGKKFADIDALKNPFSLLKANMFEFRKYASGDGLWKYDVPSDKKDDDDVNAAFSHISDFFNSVIGQYYVSLSNLTEEGAELKTELTSASLTMNLTQIQSLKFELNLSTKEKGKTSFSSAGWATITLTLFDVGSTLIEDSEVKKTPYSVSSQDEAAYRSFRKARSEIASSCYSFRSTCHYGSLLTNSYVGRVISSGYSVQGKTYQNGEVASTTYFGIHSSDNRSQYYSSSTPNGLKGKKEMTYRKPDFDFKEEIFQRRADDSAGNYVFSLQPDLLTINNVEWLAYSMDATVLGSYASSDLLVTISPAGEYVSLACKLTQNGNTFDYEITYSEIDDSETIPSELADFSDWTDVAKE